MPVRKPGSPTVCRKNDGEYVVADTGARDCRRGDGDGDGDDDGDGDGDEEAKKGFAGAVVDSRETLELGREAGEGEGCL